MVVYNVAVSFRSIIYAKCMPTLSAAALVTAVPLQSLTSRNSSGFALFVDCCDSCVSVALVFGVGLHFALSSICGSAILVVLPG